MALPILVVLFATTCAGIFILRRYMAGGVFKSKKLMTGKVVLITGANCGIGKATACELAKRNARVIMACRNLLSAADAVKDIRKITSNGELVIKELNLASLQSVRDFCSNILRSEKKLDVLINNAGIMECPYGKTEDGFEMHFGVNHLGHYLLTNLLLDLLKNSAPSRIVVVSSLLHKRGTIDFDNINYENNCDLYIPRQAYCNSKLANLLFAHQLKKRLEGTNVSVFSLHPGIVWSSLGRHWMKQHSKMFLYCLYPLGWLFAKSPYAGCQTSLFCAISETLECRPSGYFGDCKEKPVSLLAEDEDVSQRLWKVSEKMVGLA